MDKIYSFTACESCGKPVIESTTHYRPGNATTVYPCKNCNLIAIKTKGK